MDKIGTFGTWPGWWAILMAFGPAQGWAANVPPLPLPVVVRPVVVDILPKMGETDAAALKQAIEGRVVRQLAQLDVDIKPDALTRLTIVIDWRDDAHTSYAIMVVLKHKDKLLAHDDASCELCGTTELFEEILRSVKRVAWAVPQVSSEPTSEPTTQPTASADPETQGHGLEAPGLKGLGWTGLGLVGAGAVVIPVGAALWAKGRVVEVDAMETAWRVKQDFRPQGITLVAAGSAVLVAGAVMLVVDAARSRRRPVAIAPIVGFRSFGVAIVGVF